MKLLRPFPSVGNGKRLSHQPSQSFAFCYLESYMSEGQLIKTSGRQFHKQWLLGPETFLTFSRKWAPVAQQHKPKSDKSFCSLTPSLMFIIFIAAIIQTLHYVEFLCLLTGLDNRHSLFFYQIPYSPTDQKM